MSLAQAKKEISPGVFVEVLADGTRIQTSNDGTVLKIHPDGTKIQTNKQGIVVEVRPDGTKKQTTPSGVVVETFLDGRTLQTDPSGRRVETFPNGDKKVLNVDGSTLLTRKDGTRQQVDANGDVYEITADGKKLKQVKEAAYKPATTTVTSPSKPAVKTVATATATVTTATAAKPAITGAVSSNSNSATTNGSTNPTANGTASATPTSAATTTAPAVAGAPAAGGGKVAALAAAWTKDKGNSTSNSTLPSRPAVGQLKVNTNVGKLAGAITTATATTTTTAAAAPSVPITAPPPPAEEEISKPKVTATTSAFGAIFKPRTAQDIGASNPISPTNANAPKSFNAPLSPNGTAAQKFASQPLSPTGASKFANPPLSPTGASASVSSAPKPALTIKPVEAAAPANAATNPISPKAVVPEVQLDVPSLLPPLPELPAIPTLKMSDNPTHSEIQDLQSKIILLQKANADLQKSMKAIRESAAKEKERAREAGALAAREESTREVERLKLELLHSQSQLAESMKLLEQAEVEIAESKATSSLAEKLAAAEATIEQMKNDQKINEQLQEATKNKLINDSAAREKTLLDQIKNLTTALEGDAASLKASLQAAQEQARLAMEAQADTQSELDETMKQLEEARNNIDVLSREKAELGDLSTALKARLEAYEERNEKTNQKVANATDKLKELRVELIASEAKAAKATSDLQVAREEINSLQLRLYEAEAELAKSFTDLTDLSDKGEQLNAARAEAKKLADEKADLEVKIMDLSNKNAELETKITALESKTASGSGTSETEVATMKQQIAEYEGLLMNASMKNDDLDREIRNLKNEVADLKLDLEISGGKITQRPHVDDSSTALNSSVNSNVSAAEHKVDTVTSSSTSGNVTSIELDKYKIESEHREIELRRQIEELSDEVRKKDRELSSTETRLRREIEHLSGERDSILRDFEEKLSKKSGGLFGGSKKKNNAETDLIEVQSSLMKKEQEVESLRAELDHLRRNKEAEIDDLKLRCTTIEEERKKQVAEILEKLEKYPALAALSVDKSSQPESTAGALNDTLIDALKQQLESSTREYEEKIKATEAKLSAALAEVEEKTKKIAELEINLSNASALSSSAPVVNETEANDLRAQITILEENVKNLEKEKEDLIAKQKLHASDASSSSAPVPPPADPTSTGGITLVVPTHNQEDLIKIQSLEARLDEAERDADSERRRVKEVSSQIEVFEKQVDELRALLEQKSEKKGGLFSSKKKDKATEQNIAELINDISNKEREVASLQVQLSEVGAGFDRERKRLQERISELESSKERELSEMKSVLDTITAEKASTTEALNEKLKTLSADIDKLKADLEAMKHENEELKKAADAAKAAANAPRATGFGAYGAAVKTTTPASTTTAAAASTAKPATTAATTTTATAKPAVATATTTTPAVTPSTVAAAPAAAAGGSVANRIAEMKKKFGN